MSIHHWQEEFQQGGALNGLKDRQKVRYDLYRGVSYRDLKYRR